jgi:hypothetical protein
VIIVYHQKNKVTAVKQNQLDIIGFVGQAVAAVMVQSFKAAPCHVYRDAKVIMTMGQRPLHEAPALSD